MESLRAQCAVLPQLQIVADLQLCRVKGLAEVEVGLAGLDSGADAVGSHLEGALRV